MITEYEIIDHGVESEQYFQGCGTCYTKYNHVVTGCGSSPSEAITDCLEQIEDYEIEENDDIQTFYGTDYAEFTPCSFCEYAGDENMCDGCELHYYISIRYNDTQKR